MSIRTAAALRDPDWHVHRYDTERDAYHLIPASRRQRSDAVFLTDDYIGNSGNAVSVARTDALAAAGERASPPGGYIFHSAFCCSTLLANALEQPGTAMTLKEPVVLNDLSGWRRRGAEMRAVAARLADTLTVLEMNVPAGETLVIKPSNVVNAFAPAMMALRPAARAILLYASLETYVASIASKGMWGRLWVRDLWAKLDADGLCDLGFDRGAAMGWTDLQVAAMGWLAQHRLFAAMTERFGDRICTLDSADLLADVPRAMAALVDHFSLPVDPTRLSCSPAFKRNAKTGEAFGPAEREAVHTHARAANRDEIEKVVAWAKAVADANSINLALRTPLLG